MPAVITKLCTGCNRKRPIEEFHWRSKARGKRISRCRKCASEWSKNHYKKNRSSYIKKASKWNRAQKLELAIFLLEYLKTHPCVDCGETDPLVLDFDHVRDKKFFNISMYSTGKYKLESLKKEIKKCDVRCANDHRRRTAVQYGWLKLSLLSSKGKDTSLVS